MTFRISKKIKTDIQHGCRGSHLGFSIGMNWAINLQVAPIPPIKFPVSWPFRLRNKSNYIFKMAALASILDFRSWWFSYFYLQVTLMLPTKFPINWPFGSGEKVQNRFSTRRLWRPSWISARNDFNVLIYSHPDTTPLSFESVGLSIQEKSIQEKKFKIDLFYFKIWPPFCSLEWNHFSYFGKKSYLDKIPVKSDWNWPRSVGVVVS